MTLSVLSLQLSSRGVRRTEVRAAIARPATDAPGNADIPHIDGRAEDPPRGRSGGVASEQLRILHARAAPIVEVGVDIDRLRHVEHAGERVVLRTQQGKCGW
jgi:hypothetical protein